MYRENGFTYVETIFTLMIALFVIPTFFVFIHAIQKDVHQDLTDQALLQEQMAYQEYVDNELRFAWSFQVDETKKQIIAQVDSDEWILLRLSQHKLIRSVRTSSRDHFQGTTVITTSIKDWSLKSDSQGVQIQINWEKNQRNLQMETRLYAYSSN